MSGRWLRILLSVCLSMQIDGYDSKLLPKSSWQFVAIVIAVIINSHMCVCEVSVRMFMFV